VPDATDPTMGEYQPIDKLVYGYEGSKLNSVTDKISDALARTQGFKVETTAYTYDPNGNLWTDSGKGISQNISYNLLNLPEHIQIGSGVISHEYTFSAEKLKKITNNYTRTYLGGLEYKDGTLEFISIPNGRILKEGDTEHYQYNLTDHLGNVVVMFEDVDEDGIIQIEEETDADPNAVAEVLQRNLYYSFGMRVDMPKFNLGDEPKNNYLYNGKELNSDFGLDWSDYGARYYDASIARWNSIDPSAERGYSLTPYNYTFNNPISFGDPDGRWPIETIWDAANVIYDLGKIGAGYATGNAGWVSSGSVDLGLDVGAMLIPYVPAGVTKLRYADDVVDAVQIVDGKADDVVRGAFKEGGDAKKAAELDIAKELDEGVIYKIPSKDLPSGKAYVGSADDLTKRAKTATDGRNRKNAEQIGSYPKGDKAARKKAEQRGINQNGGKKELDNKRDEIQRKKWKNNGIDPPKNN